jgi:DNA-binding CsgD family transcriptional regulator
LNPSIVDSLASRRDGVAMDELKIREIDVLELIAHGLSNRSIATTMDLTVKAVEKCITAIFRKLDPGRQISLLCQPPETVETPIDVILKRSLWLNLGMVASRVHGGRLWPAVWCCLPGNGWNGAFATNTIAGRADRCRGWTSGTATGGGRPPRRSPQHKKDDPWRLVGGSGLRQPMKTTRSQSGLSGVVSMVPGAFRVLAIKLAPSSA